MPEEFGIIFKELDFFLRGCSSITSQADGRGGEKEGGAGKTHDDVIFEWTWSQFFHL